MEPIPPRAFERLVGDALDTLPAPLGELMENVAIVVEDQHPTEDLLGLYEGIPLTDKSLFDQPMNPALPAVNDSFENGAEQARSLIADFSRRHFALDLTPPSAIATSPDAGVDSTQ